MTLTCCAFCSYSNLLIAPLFVMNWRSLLSKSRPHRCQSQDRTASKYNPLNSSMKLLQVDLHQIERRLCTCIISRTRPRATQESSEETYRSFHFVNSSETFQHLCGFSRKPLGEPPKHFPLNNTLSSENYT